VFEGAAVLLDKIHAAAARRLGCRPDEVEITDSAARTRDGRSVALAELAGDGLKADASFANDQRLTYACGYAFSSRLISSRKRQSVCSAMSVLGLVRIKPASCSRAA
jgi:CO/xanthine dehydrogenase Mo-binding subunit